MGDRSMSAYWAKAQPYLDAIAKDVFTSQDVRDWLIRGTAAAANYVEAVFATLWGAFLRFI
jgi:hypothetical protein